YFVVGENAASVDNLAMTDIAASMKYLKADDSTTVTVEGDNWKVGTSAKFLEMANSNATASAIGSENFADITTFIGNDELAALKDGTWSTSEADYNYQQFLFFDTDADTSISRIVKYVEDDSDKTADHFYVKNGKPIARYKMEFTSTAESDVTDSSGSADTTGTYLDDFENTDLSILGKDFSVVLARRPASGPQGGGGSVKLTLMSGSTRDTLLEGESKSYKVGDKEYDVTLSFVDSDEAKFTVNGEATNKLKVGETSVLADKSEVGVSEILYQDYAGGVHSTTFFIGASKMELRDDDVADSGGSYNIKVGSEDIDGTKVVITGSDNNVTFRINTIEVNMTTEDDYFVSKGGKLSEAIAANNEESEVLMNGGFDIEYQGLEAQVTHDIKLKSSSAKRYNLQLFDGDSKPVDLPVAYAESATILNMSEETGQAARSSQNRLVLDKTFPLFKNDYFVVTGGTASDGSAKSYLLQYKGVDKSTKTSPKIQFKNMGSGENLEYSASAVSSGATVATIKLGGYSFPVYTIGSDQSADDYPVRVAMDTSAIAFDATGNASRGQFITFVDSFGAQWSINATPITGQGVDWSQSGQVGSNNLGGNLTGIQIGMQTPNADDYDTSVPTKLVLNVTSASGPEVRGNILTSGTWAGVAAGPITLITPDGESEVSYGYTSMGTFITYKQPSSDPQELILAYPEKQSLPQVYITSGATSSSTTAGGTLTKVEVVDATKLDSEIADAKAQNLIVVGGPCVNTVAAELLGSPASCTEGFTPGKARVKLFEQANGNVAMLVAGYSGADTRLAGKVLANTNKVAAAGGMEVEIEGTTTADAVVGAPAAVETTEVAATETTTQ
ncbi:MAG: hypothetical protein HY361_04990, partial [Candidatus Aenigmarchaeota archaeon]|nr:hypothetical protein [Candidatus Aenigmarchaeota archaeon]